jgi:isoleucyl-tRNA synthetase
MDLIKKVETLKKVIESGRAARKKANIKVRQPLSNLKIYENDPSITSFILDQQQIILDELNIKTISIVKDLKDMGSFSIKPNFKILSSKFDEDMQTVVKYIATLDQYDVMDKYLSNKNIDSEKFDIIKEDIIIQIQGHEKEEAFFSNDVIVSISTEIDETLAAEGLIRELIRHIQVMRKEADFNVDDRIILSGKFSSEINGAIDNHKEYFMNEILCTDIVDSLENSDYNSVFKHNSEEFNVLIKKKV